MTIFKSFAVMLGLIIGVATADSAIAQSNSAAETVASGGFTNVDMRTSGTWSLETRADGVYAVLASNFKARKAPDLKIFLSKLPAANVDGDNATDGVFVAELKSHKGAQAYKLPAGIDLASFKSFVIHCQQYSKFWAAGDIGTNDIG